MYRKQRFEDINIINNFGLLSEQASEISVNKKNKSSLKRLVINMPTNYYHVRIIITSAWSGFESI